MHISFPVSASSYISLVLLGLCPCRDRGERVCSRHGQGCCRCSLQYLVCLLFSLAQILHSNFILVFLLYLYYHHNAFYPPLFFSTWPQAAFPLHTRFFLLVSLFITFYLSVFTFSSFTLFIFLYILIKLLFRLSYYFHYASSPLLSFLSTTSYSSSPRLCPHRSSSTFWVYVNEFYVYGTVYCTLEFACVYGCVVFVGVLNRERDGGSMKSEVGSVRGTKKSFWRA